MVFHQTRPNASWFKSISLYVHTVQAVAACHRCHYCCWRWWSVLAGRCGIHDFAWAFSSTRGKKLICFYLLAHYKVSSTLDSLTAEWILYRLCIGYRNVGTGRFIREHGAVATIHCSTYIYIYIRVKILYRHIFMLCIASNVSCAEYPLYQFNEREYSSVYR